jgi:hypothetical protein
MAAQTEQPATTTSPSEPRRVPDRSGCQLPGADPARLTLNVLGMFARLNREELTELCAKMGRALHASHEASTEPGAAEAWDGRRDVHAELMRLQPELWSACRTLGTSRD